MISYSEAIQAVREVARTARTPGTELVALEEAIGRIAAENVLSPELLPRHPNSSMDGFAVRAEWTLRARTGQPMNLPVLGTIVAGDAPPENATRVGAWQIMTGAPFPSGLDACIRVEDVNVRRDARGTPLEIEFEAPAVKNQNLRDAGGDFRPGDLVIPRGAVIGPEQGLALAALGITHVSVFRKAKIALLSTGKEIVDAGAASKPCQVRNSTAPFLKAAAAQLGHTLVSYGKTGDDPESFERTMQEIFADRPDLVITTGAVSMGIHDFVGNSLRKLGAEVLFHKVSIRPGKPILFARFSDGPVVFALPGNPISTVVGLRFFAEIYLREIYDMGEEQPIRARLIDEVEKLEGLRSFLKARLIFGQGEPQVEILPGQMSSLISPLLASNAWAILSEEGTELARGSWIDVYPMYASRFDFTARAAAYALHRSETGCC